MKCVEVYDCESVCVYDASSLHSGGVKLSPHFTLCFKMITSLHLFYSLTRAIVLNAVCTVFQFGQGRDWDREREREWEILSSVDSDGLINVIMWIVSLDEPSSGLWQLIVVHIEDQLKNTLLYTGECVNLPISGLYVHPSQFCIYMWMSQCRSLFFLGRFSALIAGGCYCCDITHRASISLKRKLLLQAASIVCQAKSIPIFFTYFSRLRWLFHIICQDFTISIVNRDKTLSYFACKQANYLSMSIPTGKQISFINWRNVSIQQTSQFVPNPNNAWKHVPFFGYCTGNRFNRSCVLPLIVYYVFVHMFFFAQ